MHPSAEIISPPKGVIELSSKATSTSLRSADKVINRLEILSMELFEDVLNHLEIRDFISLSFSSRAYLNLTNLYFPMYASHLFFRHKVSMLVYGGFKIDNMADIIRKCRTEQHKKIALNERPYPHPQENNCWLSQYAWTCGEMSIDFDKIPMEILAKMSVAYQPVTEFLAGTNTSYCGRTGSFLSNGGKGFLYELAWKCRQFKLPWVSTLVERMSFDEKIRFQIDYHLYLKEFEEALKCALGIDEREYGFDRTAYLGYVIRAIGKNKIKLLEALLVIILNVDPRLKFTCKKDGEGFGEALSLLREILEKVWQERGLPEAIEFASLIPYTQWRCEAISHLIYCLSDGPGIKITYGLTTAHNYVIEANIEEAIHLFERLLPDSEVTEDHKRLIQAYRAVYIINALLKKRAEKRARNFLPFLKDNKVGDQVFSNHSFSYFYSKVASLYFRDFY